MTQSQPEPGPSQAKYLQFGPFIEKNRSSDDVRQAIAVSDPRMARALMGDLGQNLKIMEGLLGVQIHHRGDQITVDGSPKKLHVLRGLLIQISEVIASGFQLHASDFDQACRLIVRQPDVQLLALYNDTIFVGGKKKRVHPRSPNQRDYIQAIRDSSLVFGVGPAGTGKTYLAMAMAVAALFRDEVRRIILCRPAVEAGEKLGFLPGDLTEKVNPYLRPLYDALFDLVGFERARRLIERNVIEVAPLAFMRGRTLSSAFVILDEAQNTTPQQMKMFLTRLGMDSCAVVTGDSTQVDLPHYQRSGLMDAMRVLRNIEEIRMVRLTDADVVRHSLVSAIVRAYARAEGRNEREPSSREE